MYRQQVAKKTSPSFSATTTNKKTIPTPSYGSLSGTIQRASASPETLREDEWLQLNRAIGTRATKKIKLGKRTSYVPEFKGISAQLAQECGQNVAPIQAKLTIGAVGDKYEQEADRLAAKVVQQINRPAPVSNEQGEMVQGKKSKEEKRDLQLKPTIQRSADVGEEASTDIESAINSARGGGQPLEEGLQKSMEQAIGADFSGVRVHSDAKSDRLNQSIQAQAFTTGQDVFFRQGAYQPRSRKGEELIAHELTHVVQQNMRIGNRVQKKPFDEQKIEKDKILNTVRSISGKDDLVLNIRVLSKRELAGEYFPKNYPGLENYDDSKDYDMVKDMVPAAFCRKDDGYVFVNKEEFGNDQDGYDYDAINAVLIHETQHAASHEFKGFQKGHGVDLPDFNNDNYQFILDEAVTDYFAMMNYAAYKGVRVGTEEESKGTIDDYLKYTNHYFGDKSKKIEKNWYGYAITEMIEKGLFSVSELKDAYMKGEQLHIIRDNKDQIIDILRKYK